MGTLFCAERPLLPLHWTHPAISGRCGDAIATATATATIYLQLSPVKTQDRRPPTKLRATAVASLSIEEVPPNARRRRVDRQERSGGGEGGGEFGFSLGVDMGLSRTGLAISKGFCVRPLTVLELRGQKLELRLLEIAEDEEADEFIIGLPRSWDGKETPQSNKVRSVAGRLAVRAAERGWRVYLQDEHGTSMEATYRMINMGLNKSTRQKRVDAYAAVMVLERYFSTSGEGTELVLPKQLDLQDKIRKGPPRDMDFYSD